MITPTTPMPTRWSKSMISPASAARGAHHDRSASASRRIPDSLDPTFAGDPVDDDRGDVDESVTNENIAIIEGDLGDVLQMTEPPSPLDPLSDPEDPLSDPEDESLDLPAEEEAMHVIPDGT